uniref:Uncharacterized protein n=1 Tax=Caenorhabditis japonica TaxID=281687 RepID=A0A8R1EY10_CAEJA
MKPYNFLKNHDYRKKRVQDAAEQLREAAGDCQPGQFINNVNRLLTKEGYCKYKMSAYEGFKIFPNAKPYERTVLGR